MANETARLKCLRDSLRRDLSSSRSLDTYRALRPTVPGLAEYPTLYAVIAALDDSQVVGYERQDVLLRTLVEQVQSHPGEQLWRSVLLFSFLPMLILCRARTRSGEHGDDIDSVLWSAFIETITKYPLHRRGSVAAGIKRDTRAVYFKALGKEAAQRQSMRDLHQYARMFQDFTLGEHLASPPAGLDPDEMDEVTQIIRDMPVSEADADLVAATAIEKMSFQDYMQSRGMLTGNETDDRRQMRCLWQRSHRAKLKIRSALQPSAPQASRACAQG